MKVRIAYRGRKKDIQLNDKARVSDIFQKTEINPETVIVKRNDEILTEDEKLKENDNIELIRIVSGG